MRMTFKSLAGLATVGVSAIAAMGPAHADSVADFYKGTTVELIVGSAVGGGYDAYARFLTRHLSRFIPGHPTIVVKNMPGAGGMIAANYVYKTAAKDGSVITHIQNTLTLDQIANRQNLASDMREFQWIGSMNTQATICVLGPHVKFDSAKDFVSREFIIGATQINGSTGVVPSMMNALVGTKFKIVAGYKGTGDVTLAIERKEIEAMCGWGWDSAQVQADSAFENGQLRIGLDIGNIRHPELARRKIPFVMDMMPDGLDKEALGLLLSPQNYGRPFAAPPGIPSDRLAALRKAFDETLKDPTFLADANNAKLQILYMSPDDIAKSIKAAFDAPEAVRKRAIEVLDSTTK